MEITRTSKVKIDLAFDVAKRTIQQWNAACNHISQVAFDNLAIAHNTLKLNDLTYTDVKSGFGLSAQVTQNAVRQVSAKYQSAKTSKTKLKQAIFFKPSNAIALQGGNRGRDFGFRSDGLSIWTVDGRIKGIAFYGSSKLKEYLADWKLCDAKMFISNGKVFLSVSFSKEVEPVVKLNNAVIGVDRGINFLAVTTDGQKSQFFGGAKVTHVRNRYLKNRASLQRKKAMKNTRSVRRAFKRLSGKEARYMRDVNHVVSRGIVDFARQTGSPTIAIEQLDGIRDDTKKRLRKEQRSAVNSWAFYQLEQFLRYKAADFGFDVIEVDAKYTSQGCSKCGHTEKANRHSHRFACKACGYQLHSDLNAARNIKLRGILTRQALCQDGSPSVGLMHESSLRDYGQSLVERRG
jgi:IS605 OrfB family transposase